MVEVLNEPMKNNSARYKFFCFLFHNGYPLDSIRDIILWWQRNGGPADASAARHVNEMIRDAGEIPSKAHWHLVKPPILDLHLGPSGIVTPFMTWDVYQHKFAGGGFRNAFDPELMHGSPVLVDPEIDFLDVDWDQFDWNGAAWQKF